MNKKTPQLNTVQIPNYIRKYIPTSLSECRHIFAAKNKERYTPVYRVRIAPRTYLEQVAEDMFRVVYNIKGGKQPAYFPRTSESDPVVWCVIWSCSWSSISGKFLLQ